MLSCLQVTQSYGTIYDQPNVEDVSTAGIFRDDVCYKDQPFRHLEGWYVKNLRSNKILPLPENYSFSGKTYRDAVLIGWLKPRHQQNQEEHPLIQCQISNLDYMMFDRSRSFRGIWVKTKELVANAQQQPPTHLCRNDKKPIYWLHRPAFQHQNLKFRVQTAVLSNIFDFCSPALLPNQSITDLHAKLTEEIGHEPFNVDLLARYKGLIVPHLDGWCLLPSTSLFFKSLRSLKKPSKKLAEAELVAKCQEAENKSRQYPWGEPWSGSEWILENEPNTSDIERAGTMPDESNASPVACPTDDEKIDEFPLINCFLSVEELHDESDDELSSEDERCNSGGKLILQDESASVATNDDGDSSVEFLYQIPGTLPAPPLLRRNPSRQAKTRHTVKVAPAKTERTVKITPFSPQEQVGVIDQADVGGDSSVEFLYQIPGTPPAPPLLRRNPSRQAKTRHTVKVTPTKTKHMVSITSPSPKEQVGKIDQEAEDFLGSNHGEGSVLHLPDLEPAELDPAETFPETESISDGEIPLPDGVITQNDPKTGNAFFYDDLAGPARPVQKLFHERVERSLPTRGNKQGKTIKKSKHRKFSYRSSPLICAIRQDEQTTEALSQKSHEIGVSNQACHLEKGEQKKLQESQAYSSTAELSGSECDDFTKSCTRQQFSLREFVTAKRPDLFKIPLCPKTKVCSIPPTGATKMNSPTREPGRRLSPEAEKEFLICRRKNILNLIEQQHASLVVPSNNGKQPERNVRSSPSTMEIMEPDRPT